MNSQFQFQKTLRDWTTIPKEQRERIITLVGEMIRRQIEVQGWGIEANEHKSHTTVIDTS
jgi:hypothetical protein